MTSRVPPLLDPVWPVKVKSSGIESRGRDMVASKVLHAYDTVYSCDAYALAIHDAEFGFRCAVCGRHEHNAEYDDESEEFTLEACPHMSERPERNAEDDDESEESLESSPPMSECRLLFCSEKCSVQHNESSCKYLAAYLDVVDQQMAEDGVEEVDTSFERLLIDIAWRRQVRADKKYDFDRYTLESHIDDMPSSQQNEALNCVMALYRFLPNEDELGNAFEFGYYATCDYVREAMTLIALLWVNSFELTDAGTGCDIGTGLFLAIAATVNHSCEPNVVAVFGEDGTLSLRAITDIPRNSPILVSYINVLGSDRKEYLKDNYYFDCECHRCTDSSLSSDALADADYLLNPNVSLQEGVTKLTGDALKSLRECYLQLSDCIYELQQSLIDGDGTDYDSDTPWVTIREHTAPAESLIVDYLRACAIYENFPPTNPGTPLPKVWGSFQGAIGDGYHPGARRDPYLNMRKADVTEEPA